VWPTVNAANTPENSCWGTLRSALCVVMKTIENDNTKERKKGRKCLCCPSVLVVTGEKISP